MLEYFLAGNPFDRVKNTQTPAINTAKLISPSVARSLFDDTLIMQTTLVCANSLCQQASELPSEVLQRRPDILAAEHTLQAANADIGAARSAFFPRILLTGSAGTASAKLADLFTSPSATWSFSPQITIPIFNLGATKSKLDVAKLTKRIEIANYEKLFSTPFVRWPTRCRSAPSWMKN